MLRTIRRGNKSERHAIDDASFPHHPTHILSTRPTLPHCVAALLQYAEESTSVVVPQPGAASDEGEALSSAVLPAGLCSKGLRANDSGG